MARRRIAEQLQTVSEFSGDLTVAAPRARQRKTVDIAVLVQHVDGAPIDCEPVDLVPPEAVREHAVAEMKTRAVSHDRPGKKRARQPEEHDAQSDPKDLAVDRAEKTEPDTRRRHDDACHPVGRRGREPNWAHRVRWWVHNSGYGRLCRQPPDEHRPRIRRSGACRDPTTPIARHAERMNGRLLNDNERALVTALLDGEPEAGRDLRLHLNSVRVRSGCNCGCGSLDFVYPDATTAEVDLTPPHLFPVEAAVLDEKGDPAGGVLLFVRDGRLDNLDVYSVGDEPLQLPDADRWRLVRQS